VQPQRTIRLLDYIRIIPQYVLPHFVVTKLAYWLAKSENSLIKTLFISWFKNHYQVDMSLAENENANSYASFNQFFTRALKPDARPVDPDSTAIVSPVDGSVSQIGKLNGDSILQAKGHYYTLDQLLAGQEEWCSVFNNGSFATLYLSPKDYHRIHMPCSAILKQMTYVPGKLFSVSPLTASVIPGVFARNERVLCFFESDSGPVAVILVGAMIVGGMETIWQGTVTPPHRNRVNHWHYTDRNPKKIFEKGNEMGRFNLGSTVILLFSENQVTWSKEFSAASEIRMGQKIATINK